MEKSQTKKKAAVIGIIVLLLILIGLAVTIVFLLLGRGHTEPDTGNVYTIDQNNYSQIMEEMEAKVDQGYFETYMNFQWTFENGTTETQDAVLGNSPNNTTPIRCEVLLSDTGEKIFSTGVLPIGTELPPFKLDMDLDAGVYPAVCMVYLLEEAGDGTFKDYSSAGFSVTITVQN